MHAAERSIIVNDTFPGFLNLRRLYENDKNIRTLVDLSFDRVDTHSIVLRIPHGTFIFKISHALSFSLYTQLRLDLRIIFPLSSFVINEARKTTERPDFLPHLLQLLIMQWHSSNQLCQGRIPFEYASDIIRSYLKECDLYK